MQSMPFLSLREKYLFHHFSFNLSQNFGPLHGILGLLFTAEIATKSRPLLVSFAVESVAFFKCFLASFLRIFCLNFECQIEVCFGSFFSFIFMLFST
jgi:hypothetical protein